MDRVVEQPRDEREGTLVGRPVFGVGAQPLGERAQADAGEGRVEGDANAGEGERRNRAVPADQGWQGRGGGELRQGGQAEQGTERGRTHPGRTEQLLPRIPATTQALRRTPAARRAPNHRRHQKKSHRVEVRAPGGLDDQQRRPQVPDQHGGRLAAGSGGDPLQQQGTAEIESEPHELGTQDGPAKRPHQPEQKLRQRRIDGRDLGMIDLRVPGRANGQMGLVAGRVAVGIEALAEHMAVPQVPVDVVRQFGRQRQKRQPCKNADAPEEGD